jgi:hypothetical protein
MSCTAIAKCTWLIRARSVFCGTAKVGPKSTLSLTSGKSSAGSVCSVKRLLPPCSVSLLARGQRHHLVGRQAAQDVDQLARTHRGAELAGITAQRGLGAHLDLQVAGGELDVLAVLAQQHVGQDGQRVPALHDAGHRLQGFKQIGLGAFRTIMSSSL